MLSSQEKHVSLMVSNSIVPANNPEKARELFFKEVENCYWNPKLKIKILDSGDRIVIANATVEKNEALVILNPDTYFGEEKAEKYTKEKLSALKGRLKISAYLYQFYTQHTQKFPKGYDHYFNALPSYEWYSKNHLLLKTYLGLNEKQKADIKEQFCVIEQIEELLNWAKDIPDHNVNVEQAIRSVFICTTRTWSVGLVPWIDFFNHEYDGSALSNNSTTITATHEYEAGQEVNTTYGMKDSLQILNIYGFCSKEKTLTIPRPVISPFAIALNPDFETYNKITRNYPFLINENIDNPEILLEFLRLCVLDKIDIINIQDIDKARKNIININNEYRAIKLGLFCLKTVKEQIEKSKRNFLTALGTVPKAWEDDFNVKFEIIETLIKKIFIYWVKLIEDDNE